MQDPLADIHNKRAYDLATQVADEIERSRFCPKSSDNVDLTQSIYKIIQELDLALLENENYLSEINQLREDHRHLERAYERERESKRNTDSRLHEIELQHEDEKEKLHQKIFQLERTVKDISMKIKMTEDQSILIEETEMKIESKYQELNDKYSQLLRSTETRFIEQLKRDFQVEKHHLTEEISRLKLEIEDRDCQVSLIKRSLQERVKMINELCQERDTLSNECDHLKKRIEFLEKKLITHTSPVSSNDSSGKHDETWFSVPMKGSCLQIAGAMIFVVVWIVRTWDGYFSRHITYCPPI